MQADATGRPRPSPTGSVVIKCTREFFEDHPVGAAEEARRLGLGKPSNLVLEREMPGLLAWALQGLQRVWSGVDCCRPRR